MKKQFLAVLLSASMAMNMMLSGASAAVDIQLSSENVTADLVAGKEIAVPVKADSNSGYSVGTVDLKWDASALTLKSIDYSTLAPDNDSAEITQGTYRIGFGNALAKDNFKKTGTFFTLNFVIADTAKAGDYTILLENASIYDTDLQLVSCALNYGTVSITGEEAEDTLSLEVGNVDALAGSTDEIRVPVTVKQNPGFTAGTVDLLWDSDLFTLKKVVFSDIAPDNSSAEIVSDGNYRIAFGNFNAKENQTATNELLTLVFQPKASAPLGSYQVMLTNPDIRNAAMELVPSSVKAGSVNVTDHITTTTTMSTTSTTTTSTTSTTATTSQIKPPDSFLLGDVNDDGVIKSDDAQAALMAYLNHLSSGYYGLTDKQFKAADVNENNVITAEDAQYILIYATQILAHLTPSWSDIISVE